NAEAATAGRYRHPPEARSHVPLRPRCARGIGRSEGVSLHMIDLGGGATGNGVSKLVLTILSAVAEAERDRTRERIARGQARSEIARPVPGRGRAPFGFRVEGKGRDARKLLPLIVVVWSTAEFRMAERNELHQPADAGGTESGAQLAAVQPMAAAIGFLQ